MPNKNKRNLENQKRLTAFTNRDVLTAGRESGTETHLGFISK
jgi:hypothetical protein